MGFGVPESIDILTRFTLPAKPGRVGNRAFSVVSGEGRQRVKHAGIAFLAWMPEASLQMVRWRVSGLFLSAHTGPTRKRGNADNELSVGLQGHA